MLSLTNQPGRKSFKKWNEYVLWSQICSKFEREFFWLICLSVALIVQKKKIQERFSSYDASYSLLSHCYINKS